MRRGALRSALSERLREGNIIVIDEITFKDAKTKEFVSVMQTLGLADAKKSVKTLIVDSLDNANLVLSSRNVQKAKVVNSFGLNIYDLIYHEKLVLSKSAVEELNDLLDPKREGKAEVEVVEVRAEEKTKKEAKPKAKKEKAEKTEAKVEETRVTEEATENE
jgi:hypothetical protein